ncbi:MAG: preprotein translocase subunit YajC [Rhodospirillales bacterium]|nr:preprotein translocase subunit YajC [Rhodospirillales bacterium]
MFISTAFAQAANGDGGTSTLIQLAPLALIFVVFYFLIIRPQQKKTKEHKAMIEALRRGDRVVTSGGLIGTVAKVTGDREIIVEIADGVRVRVLRGMVSEIMSKTEPADSKDAKKTGAPARLESTEDYYSHLGLKKGVSAAEIAAAFASKSGDEKAAEAYETLKDPVRRKLYDSLGHDEYLEHLKD